MGYPAGSLGPRSLEVESMTQPLPTHELIERLKSELSSDGRKVLGGLDISTSLRVPGALSGPLAGVSFIAGVAAALALSGSPYPRPGAQPAEIRRYFRRSEEHTS